MLTRSIAQVALLVIGMIVWGYGTRVDDERLRWIGIACFAIAFLLRLIKKKEPSS
jgi:uncharacterized protein YqgC (DUF456 family)